MKSDTEWTKKLYGSRSLNKTKSNWCITDQELLAVMYYMEYSKKYLIGCKFM